MCELMTNKNIYLEFIFDHIIWKKMKPTIFRNFQYFQVKLWDLYRFQRNYTDGWFFFPEIQLFKLYKIGNLSVDSETLVFFFVSNSME